MKQGSTTENQQKQLSAGQTCKGFRYRTYHTTHKIIMCAIFKEIKNKFENMFGEQETVKNKQI